MTTATTKSTRLLALPTSCCSGSEFNLSGGIAAPPSNQSILQLFSLQLVSSPVSLELEVKILLTATVEATVQRAHFGSAAVEKEVWSARLLSDTVEVWLQVLARPLLLLSISLRLLDSLIQDVKSLLHRIMLLV